MLIQKDSERLPVIGITHGDINGIGYEIILKTLCDSRILDSFTPIVYGQSKVFSYYKKNFNMEELSYTLIRDARQAQPGRINIINHTDSELKIEPGISTEIAGKASFDALKIAVDDLYKNNIDALVTAPVNKGNIQSDIFKFSSQKKYISSFCPEYTPLMLMVSNKLRVGSVTNHVSLKDVPNIISKELILSKVEVFNKTLQRDFSIDYPRIAIMGLNPHYGDGGLYGKEEIDMIIPAIKEARDKGMLVFGPYSADGFFGSAAWVKYDGILCMYHDQAMVPFKTLAVDGGVNFTAGLPVIRTAPDHGTGYDIANRNIANPDSFRHAIYLAIDVMKNRASKE
ncbi:MAG: 4-hydroxythreonine-4-phosphate dehydrogenase PdxA [Bacteroidales bacterium]|nr:4-hydroxythreonine-4-phosphate dehydrogenase PdxA [Bacteroidales bacterium]MBR5781005.1 4-hydroxythreonine-4-phosphate dehydrogenase PdxA [Bacteroidales bacterium]